MISKLQKSPRNISYFNKQPTFAKKNGMSVKRDQEIKTIREELKSFEDVLVGKGLSKMATKGDASLLPDLINLLSETDNQKHKQESESILFGLKDKEALITLIDYLKTDANEHKKWIALNAIWQSGFDASEHLTVLVDFAINNSYTNAIDVMTIIENSEFDEKNENLVDQNLKKINDYLLKNKSDNISILLEIKSILIEKKIEG